MKAIKFKRDGEDLFVVSNASTTAKLNKLKHLREQLKTLKAVEKGLVDDIKGYIGDADGVVHNTGKVLATNKVEYFSYFNTPEFREENPELAEKYTETRDRRKFLVK